VAEVSRAKWSIKSRVVSPLHAVAYHRRRSPPLAFPSNQSCNRRAVPAHVETANAHDPRARAPAERAADWHPVLKNAAHGHMLK
jgi:hypothetical protein